MKSTPTMAQESTQDKISESVQKKPRGLGKKALEKIKKFADRLNDLLKNYGSHGEVSIEEDYHWNETHGDPSLGDQEYPDYATPSGIRKIRELEEEMKKD